MSQEHAPVAEASHEISTSAESSLGPKCETTNNYFTACSAPSKVIKGKLASLIINSPNR